ncbi:hypothetical protein VPH35_070347 [Triticum aestivum]
MLIELPILEICAENSVGETHTFNCLKELEMSDCPRSRVHLSSEILCLRKMNNSLTTLCNNLDVEVGGCITPMQILQEICCFLCGRPRSKHCEILLVHFKYLFRLYKIPSF